MEHTQDHDFKNIPIVKKCQELIDVKHDTNFDKLKFHKKAKVFLKSYAEDVLNLPSSEYDLRSNKGGDAGSGEVTLHTDKLYIQISGDKKILARTCNGRKDYCGNQNNYVNEKDLIAGVCIPANEAYGSMAKHMSRVAAGIDDQKCR